MLSLKEEPNSPGIFSQSVITVYNTGSTAICSERMTLVRRWPAINKFKVERSEALVQG